jgi:hypothetical protein
LHKRRGIAHRQVTQDKRVQQIEDGGVGADRKGQRDDGSDRERRPIVSTSDRQTHVLPHVQVLVTESPCRITQSDVPIPVSCENLTAPESAASFAWATSRSSGR